MAMKAYACPRCLTLSSTTDNGDGGVHTCTPTPLVHGLERRVAELEDERSQILAFLMGADGTEETRLTALHMLER